MSLKQRGHYRLKIPSAQLPITLADTANSRAKAVALVVHQMQRFLSRFVPNEGKGWVTLI